MKIYNRKKKNTHNKHFRIFNGLTILSTLIAFVVLSIFIISLNKQNKLPKNVVNIKTDMDTTKVRIEENKNPFEIQNHELSAYKQLYESRYKINQSTYDTTYINEQVLSLRRYYKHHLPKLKIFKFTIIHKIVENSALITVYKHIQILDDIYSLIGEVFNMRVDKYNYCSTLSKIELFILSPPSEILVIHKECIYTINETYALSTIASDMLLKRLETTTHKIPLSRVLILSKYLWDSLDFLSNVNIYVSKEKEAIYFGLYIKLNIVVMAYLFDLSQNIAKILCYSYFLENYKEILEFEKTKFNKRFYNLKENIESFTKFDKIIGGIYLFFEMVKNTKEDKDVIYILQRLKELNTDIWEFNKHIDESFIN